MILPVGFATALEDAMNAMAGDISTWIQMYVMYAAGQVNVLIVKGQAE